MAESRLGVKFTVTEDDVFRLQIYHLLYSREILLALLVCALLLFGGTAYLLMALGERIVAGMVAGLLSVLFYAALNVWGAFRRVDRWKQLVGVDAREQGVEISPDGVVWSVGSEQASQNLKWSDIHRVTGMPKYICFFLGKRSLNLIPRRAFASPEASESFLLAAREWHAAMATPRGEPAKK